MHNQPLAPPGRRGNLVPQFLDNTDEILLFYERRVVGNGGLLGGEVDMRIGDPTQFAEAFSIRAAQAAQLMPKTENEVSSDFFEWFMIL